MSFCAQKKMLRTCISLTVSSLAALCFSSNALAAGGASKHVVSQLPGYQSETSKLMTNYVRGARITASPILGRYTQQDVDSLLVNQPSMNEDLVLLEQHQLLNDAFLNIQDRGPLRQYAYPYAPLIDVGGRIEGQLVPGLDDWNGNYTSNINMQDVALDFSIYASRWVTGFFSFTTEAPNSLAVHVNRAWVTIGNLDELPVYATLGKMYVPFGSYSSNMVADPLPKQIFRINAPVALLGVTHQLPAVHGQIYGSVYGFDPSVQLHSQKAAQIGGVGGNVGYKSQFGARVASHLSGSYDLGLGVVNDISGSGGLRATVSPNAKYLSSHVPGIDVHAKVGLNGFTVLGEYISALSRYKKAELAYAEGSHALKGALVSALHVEGDYSFNLGPYNSGVYAGYDHSWQALGLSTAEQRMPEQSVDVGISSQFWKYTITSLEYRFDTDYGTSETSETSETSQTIQGSGKHQSTVTLQLGLYF